jgi:L-aminopeptidase/D-esterase-like protein
MSASNSRARDLHIPFDGTPGPANAITDVQGITVGHAQISKGSVNTGVTAILPQGNDTATKPGYPYGKADDMHSGIDTFVFAAWHTLNGCGEMTGTAFIEESGFLEGPIVLTNTVSVGTVRNAVIEIAKSQQAPDPKQGIDPDRFDLYLPVVAETYDGWLNDILDDQVTKDMVARAIMSSQSFTTSADVLEGNIGGGTGMTCYGWKGGIGTASRQNVQVYSGTPAPPPFIAIGPKNGYTVGVLVQANQGNYWDLVIRGAPVGTEMTPPSTPDVPPPPGGPGPISRTSRPRSTRSPRKSSIIVVIATDAPLSPLQLKRLARRAALGVGRTGTVTNDDSGEIFLAFSTANTDGWLDKQGNEKIATVHMLPNDSMDPLFEATVGATEEAIINALVAARTLTGRANHTAWWILDPNLEMPANETLLDVLKKYNRLTT